MRLRASSYSCPYFASRSLQFRSIPLHSTRFSSVCFWRSPGAQQAASLAGRLVTQTSPKWGPKIRQLYAQSATRSRRLSLAGAPETQLSALASAFAFVEAKAKAGGEPLLWLVANKQQASKQAAERVGPARDPQANGSRAPTCQPLLSSGRPRLPSGVSCSLWFLPFRSPFLPAPTRSLYIQSMSTQNTPTLSHSTHRPPTLFSHSPARARFTRIPPPPSLYLAPILPSDILAAHSVCLSLCVRLNFRSPIAREHLQVGRPHEKGRSLCAFACALLRPFTREHSQPLQTGSHSLDGPKSSWGNNRNRNNNKNNNNKSEISSQRAASVQQQRPVWLLAPSKQSGPQLSTAAAAAARDGRPVQQRGNGKSPRARPMRRNNLHWSPAVSSR